MKKLIVLALFVFACFGLFAQKQISLQRAFTSRADFFYKNKQLFIGGQWQDSVGNNCVALQQLDYSKDSFALKSIINIDAENGRLLHVIQKIDNTGYVAIFFEEGCKSATPGNYILHLDNQFTITKPKERIRYFFRNIREPISYAGFINSSTLVLSTKQLVTTYNINTYKALAFNDSLKSYGVVIPLKESFACIEKNYFRVFDMNCDLQGQQIIDFVPKQILKLKTNNGYIILGNKHLGILNIKGITIYEHNWSFLSNDFDSLKNCFYHDDTLAIVGYKNNAWKVDQLTDQFGIISTFEIGKVIHNFNNQALELNDLIFDGNKILCLKQFEINDQKSDLIEIYKRSSSLNISGVDLEIKEITIDSVKSTESKKLLNCQFFSSYTIKNLGSDTLKSFFINWQSSKNNDCSGPKKSIRIDCNLAPNQADTFYLNFSDSFLVPKSLYEVCFYASSPNNLFDTFWLNNTICTKELLPPLSVNDLELSQIKFPTLVRAGQFVSLSNQISNIEFYDINGRKVETIKATNSFYIPENLNTSMYFVVIKIENQILKGKICIVN